jgi:YbgC/YbaW family acyl-CoA thioester hydrolase
LEKLVTVNYLIRETHVDIMGHMNNATYLQLFEDARWDSITARGFGLSEIQKYHIGPVILEVNIKFLKEIHVRETIAITTELIEYSGKVGTLRQQMIKEDGTLAAEATFAFGLFDMKIRKLINPTPEFGRAVGLHS